MSDDLDDLWVPGRLVRSPEQTQRYELHLTILELSMLTQALIMMLPQIERTINTATGEVVTTQNLVLKLVNAGMAANARDVKEAPDAS